MSVGVESSTDRSRSDCVHEQVAKRIANVRFTFAQHFSYHASEKTSENRICRRIRSYLKLSFKYFAVHSGTSDRTSSVTPCSSNNFRTLEALMTSGFPSGPSVVIRSILMKEMPYFWENADHCLVVASCYRIKRLFSGETFCNMKDRAILDANSVMSSSLWIFATSSQSFKK